MTLLEALEQVGDVRTEEALARHTTLGIGGPADFYLAAPDTETMRRSLLAAGEAGAPVFILGSGSNILVGDAGIRGLVIENQSREVGEPVDTDALSRDGVVLVTADAGLAFARFARHVAREGLTGLEWAAGIPGTLGGAVVYNAGAYGGCLGDVLDSISVLGSDGAEQTIAAAELQLSYRSSAFTRGLIEHQAVLDLTFRLQRGEAEASLARIDELEARRKKSSPPGRSAGSTFKNPEEHPAWWLIDQVGLRGHQVGGAKVSEKHSNYFLNVGAASAADLAGLIRLAQGRIEEQFGIAMEPEVTFVGEGFE